jgi:hypothetical protein
MTDRVSIIEADGGYDLTATLSRGVIRLFALNRRDLRLLFRAIGENLDAPTNEFEYHALSWTHLNTCPITTWEKEGWQLIGPPTPISNECGTQWFALLRRSMPPQNGSLGASTTTAKTC